MIEDALKRTRQAYFLIVAIIAITIIFSFAIKKPTEIVEQKILIEKIINLDFNEYDNFIHQKIKTRIAKDSSSIFTNLDTLTLPIFGIEKIKYAFQNLDYSGRLIIKNSVFSDLSECKPTQLKDINNFEVNQNILWFVPNLEELENEIIYFLLSNNSVGLSITNIRIDGFRSENDASTFGALEEPSVSVYFELTSSVNSLSPVFSAEVYGEIDTLLNTSMVYWMKNQTFDQELVSVKNDSIVWASKAYDYPPDERNLTFAELLKNLKNDIEKFLPENQKINFLGLEIKGSLIFIASPILILIMVYFLLSNLVHLERIVQTNEEAFREFSWNALNGNQFRKVEIISVVLVAPIACLGYLVYSLMRSGIINWFLICFIVVSIAGIIFMGKEIIYHLYFLHGKLNATSKDKILEI